MDLLYSYPEILIDESQLQLESSLKFYMIDILTESIGDVSLIQRIKQACSNIINKVISTITIQHTIVQSTISKHKIQNRIKTLKKIIKDNPEIGKQKIEIVSVPNKSYEESIKMINNISIMALSKAKDDEFASLLEKFEKTCVVSSYVEELTVEEAIDRLEKEIVIFDKQFDTSIETIRKFKSINFNECDSSIVNRLSKISEKLAKSNSTFSKNIFRSINAVYKSVCSAIKKLRRKCSEFMKCYIFNTRFGDGISYGKISRTPHHYVSFNGDEIPVFVSKELKKPTNFQSPASMYRPSINSSYMIIVTKEFLDYSEDIQKSVIYHELGHIACGHLERDKIRDYEDDLNNLKKYAKAYDKSELSKYSTSLDYTGGFNTEGDVLAYIMKELEADRYSIQQMGSSQALKDGLNSFNSKCPASTNKLNELRIKLMDS